MGWFIRGDTDPFKMLVNTRELAILWNHWDSIPTAVGWNPMIWLLLGEGGRGRREEKSGIRRGKRGGRGGGGGRGRREGEKNILPLAPLFRRLNGDHRTMSRQERLVWFALKEAIPHPPISPWFENDHKVTPHCNPLHHCTRAMLSPLHKLCQIRGNCHSLFLSSHFASMWRPEIRTNMAGA